MRRPMLVLLVAATMDVVSMVRYVQFTLCLLYAHRARAQEATALLPPEIVSEALNFNLAVRAQITQLDALRGWLSPILIVCARCRCLTTMSTG